MKISYTDAAARAGVSVDTIMRRVSAGHLTRHPHPTDRRRGLIDVDQLDQLFNPKTDSTVRFEVTPLEVAQALTITAYRDPELYRVIRSAIPAKDFPAVALIASTDGLEALDIQAGYTPEGQADEQ